MQQIILVQTMPAECSSRISDQHNAKIQGSRIVGQKWGRFTLLVLVEQKMAAQSLEKLFSISFCISFLAYQQFANAGHSIYIIPPAHLIVLFPSSSSPSFQSMPIINYLFCRNIANKAQTHIALNIIHSFSCQIYNCKLSQLLPNMENQGMAELTEEEFRWFLDDLGALLGFGCFIIRRTIVASAGRVFFVQKWIQTMHLNPPSLLLSL